VRILVFNWKDLDHPAAGGAEVFTERVAEQLVARGHEVTLFVATVAGRPEREVRNGYQIVRRGSRFTVYREARAFWRSEGSSWADVVLDEVNTRPFLTPRYVRDRPVLALFHQLAREIWKYEMPFPVSVAGRYWFEPRWLRAYRDVPTITVSASSAASLAAYGLGDVEVVPQGSEPIVAPDVVKEPTPTVVFLGRLNAMKRPDDAIEAVRTIRARHPDVRLWVLGDGPRLEELQRRNDEFVELFGHVSATERELRLARAHVLVATSVREGWGLNVSEAAACGTPAIGYAVPGLVDSVPASGGLLVEPGPAALAGALDDFFAGTTTLEPRISTVPWSVTADAVEQKLTGLLARA
jgi:glycosyltransferase involved in cell wall biosynthesis